LNEKESNFTRRETLRLGAKLATATALGSKLSSSPLAAQNTRRQVQQSRVEEGVYENGSIILNMLIIFGYTSYPGQGDTMFPSHSRGG